MRRAYPGGLKPDFVVVHNVQAEAWTYLRSKATAKSNRRSFDYGGKMRRLRSG